MQNFEIIHNLCSQILSSPPPKFSRSATGVGQNIGEDQKKVLRCKTSWFSVRKYAMTKKKKKKEKVFANQSVGFRSQKKKTKQMVSPQNVDTRGGQPLALPSDATG